MAQVCYIYNLDDKYFFGKTIREFLNNDAEFIYKCFLILDDFCISQEAMEYAKAKELCVAEFEGLNARRIKCAINTNQRTEREREKDVDNYADHLFSESCGNYAGTYAQDVEGLSDEFIDDALGGDPDAFWNID